jgi:hypothetical protein
MKATCNIKGILLGWAMEVFDKKSYYFMAILLGTMSVVTFFMWLYVLVISDINFLPTLVTSIIQGTGAIGLYIKYKG